MCVGVCVVCLYVDVGMCVWVGMLLFSTYPVNRGSWAQLVWTALRPDSRCYRVLLAHRRSIQPSYREESTVHKLTHLS